MGVNLSEVESLDRDATPGEWEATSGGQGCRTLIDADAGDVLNHDERGHGHLRENYAWLSEPDAHLITAYRTAAPALAAAVRAVVVRHRPVATHTALTSCGQCATPWPCPTIRDVAPLIDDASLHATAGAVTPPADRQQP